MDDDDKPIPEVAFDPALLDAQAEDEEEEDWGAFEPAADRADAGVQTGGAAEGAEPGLVAPEPEANSAFHATALEMAYAARVAAVATNRSVEALDRVSRQFDADGALPRAVCSVEAAIRADAEGLAPEAVVLLVTAFDAEGNTRFDTVAGRAVGDAKIAHVGELTSGRKLAALRRVVADCRRQQPDYPPFHVEEHHLSGLSRHAKTIHACLQRAGGG